MKVTPAPYHQLDFQLRSIASKGLDRKAARSLHDSCGSEEIRVCVVASPKSSLRKRKASPKKQKDRRQQQQQGKTVKFLVDDQDAILADVCTFQKYEKDDLDEVFWPSSARMEFLTIARYDCDDVALDEADLVEALDEIYMMIDEYDEESSMKHMRGWAGSIGRGLESAVMESVRRTRKKHSKGVLKCQEKHWERGTSLETMMKVLRCQSQKSSQKSSNFAHLVALGDEAIAQDDTIDFTTSEDSL